MIKLVIIDDSALVRRAISYCFEEDEDVSIVGVFPSPVDAIIQIPVIQPDIIICDIEMPGMNGLDFLRVCSEKQWRIPVIICSAQVDNPELAMEAYSLGAVDVLLKPDMSTPKAREDSKGIFRRIVRLAYQSRSSFKFPSLQKQSTPKTISSPNNIVEKPHLENISSTKILSNSPVRRIVLIGSSTGGPEAVKSLIKALPSEMPPILIVQHMPQGFTKLFADTLNRISSLNVIEAKGGEVLKNNHIYIAPGNKQMGIVKKMNEYIIKVDDSDLVNGHRPSVDYLFHSVARTNAPVTTAIILTGMGNDGASGIKSLKEMGSPLTIAQNEETCVVFGMPKEAIATGKVDKILPLQEISPFLVKSVK